jgi:hypothetical protein
MLLLVLVQLYAHCCVLRLPLLLLAWVHLLACHWHLLLLPIVLSFLCLLLPLVLLLVGAGDLLQLQSCCCCQGTDEGGI